jgi:hypothetical protein
MGSFFAASQSQSAVPAPSARSPGEFNLESLARIESPGAQPQPSRTFVRWLLARSISEEHGRAYAQALEQGGAASKAATAKQPARY